VVVILTRLRAVAMGLQASNRSRKVKQSTGVTAQASIVSTMLQCDGNRVACTASDSFGRAVALQLLPSSSE